MVWEVGGGGGVGLEVYDGMWMDVPGVDVAWMELVGSAGKQR